jgi:hypothetical protein
MKIDKEKFKSCTTSIWDFENKVLYDLCRNYSQHNKEEEVLAKTMIIGRTYAAAIERRKNKNAMETGDDFYMRVAKILIGSKIDELINNLKKFNDFNEESIKEIVIVHTYLVGLLYPLTKQNKISFASKYLHFHHKIVPMIDSRAINNMRHIFKGDRSYRELVKKLLKECLGSNKEYVGFCCKYLLLYNFIKENCSDCLSKENPIRQIDNYLLDSK